MAAITICNDFRSDQIGHSVESDSLRPHESQHARPPCPSPTPGVYPNSCPSNHPIFCHPLLLPPSIFPSIKIFSNESVLQHSAFFIVQLSHPYMTTGKTIALPRWTLVGKVMSLLLNMLSRLVITFLPRSKRLLISFF